ncbi:hypothetical protein DFH11DRAFT_1732041 [Phellopilus nigrolimitatus]|nr:hypothetical protein DFH11DRAFT_1732041 [Phellopilus nigrolimitatus]
MRAKARRYVQLMLKKTGRVDSRRKRTHTNISKTTRVEIGLKAAAKQREMWADVNMEYARQDEVAAVLAKKYNLSLGKMKTRLRRLSKITEHRAVNPYNAFLHVRALEINEDLPEGERTRLCELQTLAAKASYDSLSDEQRDDMVACVEEFRKLKQTGSRSFRSSHAQDVKLTSDKLHEELKHLAARRDTSSMCLTVRTDSEHNNVPEYYIDTISRNFIEIYLAMSVHDFYTKFESYALLGLRGVTANDNERRTLLKKTVRAMTRSALRNITGVTKAEMSWLNYEVSIVQKYKVVVEGWPASTMDLGCMSFSMLTSIVDSIRDGSCYWKKISAEDFEARTATFKAIGNERAANRKKRNDAGVPRKPVASISDGETEGEDVSD